MPVNRQLSSITSSTLQQEIGSVLRRVAVDGEHILVERNKYPIAVIIPLEDYRQLTRSQEKHEPQLIRKHRVGRRQKLE